MDIMTFSILEYIMMFVPAVFIYLIALLYQHFGLT